MNHYKLDDLGNKFAKASCPVSDVLDLQLQKYNVTIVVAMVNMQQGDVAIGSVPILSARQTTFDPPGH